MNFRKEQTVLNEKNQENRRSIFSMLVIFFVVCAVFFVVKPANAIGVLDSQLYWDNDDVQDIDWQGNTNHHFVQEFETITATTTLYQIKIRANDLRTANSPFIYLCGGSFDSTASTTDVSLCFSGADRQIHDWDGNDWVDNGDGTITLPATSWHNWSGTELIPDDYYLVVASTNLIDTEIVLGTGLPTSNTGAWIQGYQFPTASDYPITGLGDGIEAYYELWVEEVDEISIAFPEDGDTLPTGNYNAWGFCGSPGQNISIMWWASPYQLCPPTEPTSSYYATCQTDYTWSLDESGQYLPFFETSTSTRVIAWTDDLPSWFWESNCVLLDASTEADVINVTIDDDAFYDDIIPDSCSFTSGIVEYVRCQAWYLVTNFGDAIKSKIPFGYIIQWDEVWTNTATSTDNLFQLDLSDAVPSTTSPIVFFNISSDLNSIASSTVEDAEFIMDVFFVVIGIFLIIRLTISLIKRN